MKSVRYLIVICLSATYFSCDNSNEPAKNISSASLKAEWLLKVTHELAPGESLFQLHCKKCHGARAEGDKNWKTPGLNGRFPPPPLDGTGHAWHHPMPMLMQIVRDGNRQEGGEMPGWKDKLSDGEIRSIIYWTQSLWPEKHLQTWLEIDARDIQLFHSQQ